MFLPGLCAACLAVALGNGSDAALLSTWQGRGIALRYTPDGRYVVARDGLGVTIFDALRGTIVGTSTVVKHADMVYEPMGMDVSHDGRLVVYVTNGELVMAQIPLGKTVHVKSTRLPSGAVAFSPDGATLVLDNGVLQVYSSSDLELELQRVDAGNHATNAASFSPDGRTLASAGYGTEIYLWDVRTWSLKDTLTGHPTYISSVTFSRDGRFLASGGGGKTIIVWDVATGHPLWRRDFDECCPRYCLALSPDGRWLVTSNKSEAIVLDARKGTIALKWDTRDKDGVRSAAFSPDGRRLVTSGFYNVIRLWDFDRLMARAKAQSK